MILAKGGPKFKETDLDPDAQKTPPAPLAPGTPPKMDNNGFPQLPGPGLIMMMTMGPNGPNARLVGRAQTMAQFAGLLGNQLNQPVVDKTSLTGKYDFAVEFAPDPNSFRGPGGGPLPPPPAGDHGPGGPTIPGASDPTGVPLAGALQQQLGLRLQSTRAPLDILVIEKINKTATDN
jgi:uncharacterized protein (TIGR03435 family)